MSIKERINEYITEIRCKQTGNYAIITKGIFLKDLTGIIGSIDLEKLIQNKLGYFMDTINSNRTIYTYEEFLLLKNFMIDQFSSIIVLSNNIFIEQYPVELMCSEETKTLLIDHFRESEIIDDDKPESTASVELASVFIGLKEYNGLLIGAYCEDMSSTSNKIVEKNLFDTAVKDIQKAEIITESYYDLIDESDYICFVCNSEKQQGVANICIKNYTGDLYRLIEHLKVFSANVIGEDNLRIVTYKVEKKEINYSQDFKSIMEKYWGYPSFRDLSVYDMSKLDEGEKEVLRISQERIVSDLVEQAENCNHGKSFRDIFVTAPTGAGKSVMFQIPAIYLAEKYDLLTIVISPLIGLMNDQVKNLEMKNYKYAETINSDISPIIKESIIEKVNSSKCHILYLSPETLLSRSDVEQLIGTRTIGMIIIDEAHIVTTWGKQFRPDYWYLGDHIRKLRRNQIKNKGQAFIIATFTATAIYHGVEDMYSETVNSLHMLDPITYLGYVKRNDIKIRIEHNENNRSGRNEYELSKLEDIENVIKRSIITNKKTLIYFPTVALISRCYDYFKAKKMVSQITKYYGTLSKDEKSESYESFYNKTKLIMFATKAFGMGIDINDIELIVHFAPTGNVCDYVQEIGRAARKETLLGEAYYKYDRKDFKHINRLHGLSTIKHYQLIEVIKKIDELYYNNLQRSNRNNNTQKRNAMLLDAENFSYIFGSPLGDEDDGINKVKTALLIIQKDFENKIGFSPINVRPIPLFAQGFFQINVSGQEYLNSRFPKCTELIDDDKNICRINLESIWKSKYNMYSFPKFKYLFYSKSPDLDFVGSINYNAALSVSIVFNNDYNSIFQSVWNALSNIIHSYIVTEKYVSVEDLVEGLSSAIGISKYKAKPIIEVIIASMDTYRKLFNKSTSAIVKERATNNGKSTYLFCVAVNQFFKWVTSVVEKIEKNTVNGYLYLVNDGRNYIKEASVVLGILEAMGTLSFEMLGGANSQLYIYINQIQSLKNIINNPLGYNNKLLDSVRERHLISVKMLTYLYENRFTSSEIWDKIENYFLGSIPDEVKQSCMVENPNIRFD